MAELVAFALHEELVNMKHLMPHEYTTSQDPEIIKGLKKYYTAQEIPNLLSPQRVCTRLFHGMESVKRVLLFEFSNSMALS